MDFWGFIIKNTSYAVLESVIILFSTLSTQLSTIFQPCNTSCWNNFFHLKFMYPIDILCLTEKPISEIQANHLLHLLLYPNSCPLSTLNTKNQSTISHLKTQFSPRLTIPNIIFLINNYRFYCILWIIYSEF